MGFYRVHMKGSASGQKVENVLWYQTTLAFEILDDLMAYEAALAAEFKQTVWDSRSPTYIPGKAWQDVQPAIYTLNSIEVTGFNDDGLMMQSDAYLLQVNEAGVGEGQTNGPQDYIRLNANLAPYFGLGFNLPKQGYLEVGPVGDGSVGNDGKLTTSGLAAYVDLGARLSEDLVTTSPVGVLEPIRVKSLCVPVPLSSPPRCLYTILGWRAVIDWVVTPRLYNSKRRRVEA